MKSVYTCPYCLRSYTVTQEGDYICDCGRQFYYPPMGSAKIAGYSGCAEPEYIDCSSRSIKKKIRYNYSRWNFLRSGNGDECPLARASLISATIGLISFGFFSVPALILGVSAIVVISDPFYNYKGTWMAVSGIVLGLIGLLVWGLWFFSVLS